MVKLLILFVSLLGGALGGRVLNFGRVEYFGERIVGGSTAAVGQYPHQISLKSKLYFHVCGGSIISHSWILTAAHCVFGKAPGSFEVTVGSNKLNSGGFTTDVASFVFHENYTDESTEHDIALVRLARTITFNPVVQPIKLANSSTPGDMSCWLSGWGLKSYPSEKIPDEMQHINLKTITIEECQRTLPSYPIRNSNVCTQEVRGKGACQGDFGGPLICNGIQHGIASWSIPCANGVPDVFTSVGFYRKWIKYNTGI